VIFLPAFMRLFEPIAQIALLEDTPALILVVAFFIAWIVCWLPLAVISAIATKWQPTRPLLPEQKIPFVISLYLLAPLVLWEFTRLTNTSLLSYGFVINSATINSVIMGFTLGVLTLTVIFTWQLWRGWCRIEIANIKLIPQVLLPILLVALLVGGTEELIFRGFLFTELGQSYSLWLAAIISSLIFAWLHLVWERQETTPQLPGLWLMGMVLVLARLQNGDNLGLAWGLHAGWVFCIATIDTAQLISYTAKVPEWITGIYKKPLAGVAGIVCMLMSVMILWIFF